MNIKNEDLNILINIGNTYEKLKDYKKALEYYEKVLKINENNTEVLNHKGKILFEIHNEIDEGKKCFDKILEIDDKDVNSLYYSRVISFEKKEYQEAIDFYKKCIANDKKYFPAFSEIGYINYLKSDLEDALEFIDYREKINPNCERVLFLKGMIFYRLNKMEQAIKYFEKSSNLNPGNYKNYDFLASIYALKKDFIKSNHYFDKVLEINPKSEMNLFNKGLNYTYLEEYPKSLKNYDKALEIDKNLYRCFYNKAYFFNIKKLQRSFSEF